MTSNRMRRILKELGDIQKDSQSQILAQPAGNGDDLSHLKASFPGPPDTPYEGGTYVVDIKIPQEYPFRPPVMKFETKLWHPNVSSQTVCFIPSNNFHFAVIVKATNSSLKGCNLSRYFGYGLVSRTHNQIRPPLFTSPP